MDSTKEERVEIINKIIKNIGSVGRKFFYYEPDGQYGYFKIINNRIYYVDEYTKDVLYAYSYKHLEKGFSHGGTLNALVLDFSEFIRTGKYTNGNNGYSGLYCTHWGYSVGMMQEVQKYAKQLGYLKEGAE
ncbi:hypothetical protein LHA31_10210 [Carnobacterium viridans]|uniref:Uncharacterized protein n=1 Tax=Carnobacterium viridans TaxID=174587 RepID=A0A1H0YVW5_9LACT|nr:hypothetical protein [Carnobacterium viridans]UDE94918.1 hypothetical protein LHA31_10210 [Carnobacterium viridans]SDQ19313.1 hypothetical protein SAMN04487752_1184 [Carnobacterium viridans]